MKRIIRLTESDLTRIVRRVVNESRLLNEDYPYDELKSNPTNEVIASVLYKAKQKLDDKEAWVVAALQAIKPGQASINAVSEALSKINGGTSINQWIATFMDGNELTDNLHNSTSVFGQLARIYTNGASTYVSDVPPTVVALYDVDESFKDTLKKFNYKHDSRENKSVGRQYSNN